MCVCFLYERVRRSRHSCRFGENTTVGYPRARDLGQAGRCVNFLYSRYDSFLTRCQRTQKHPSALCVLCILLKIHSHGHFVPAGFRLVNISTTIILLSNCRIIGA